MSNFVVPEDRINKNPQSANKLDNDVLRGFQAAARNNQVSLAMQYLSYIMEIIDERLPGNPVPELSPQHDLPVSEPTHSVEEPVETPQEKPVRGKAKTDA